MIGFSLIFVFVLILSTTLQAQKDDIKFKHISLQQGLSQRTVTCILQDSQGFMWFGTMDGLNKYDGYKFIVYKNDNKKTSSLTNNYVKCLFEDKDRNLWIGTAEGLDKFDREKHRFIHFDKDDTLLNIKDITQDESGNIWVATLSQGLCLFNPIKGSFLSFIHNDNDSSSIAHNEVNKIINYNKDELLLATRRGMDIFNKTTKKFIHIKEKRKDAKDIISNRIRQIY